MKIMQDPSDLDIFEGQQMEITRKVDETGMDGVHRFIDNAMTASVAPLPILLAMLPLPLWQRAAFESHDLAQRDPTAFNMGSAQLIWLTVKFVQDGIVLGKALLQDPRLMKEIQEKGFPILPDLDE